MINLDGCRNGKHKLKIIYRNPSNVVADSMEVVRWCKDCGAVVIDFDYDGRTDPGKIKKMELPLITKEQYKKI